MLSSFLLSWQLTNACSAEPLGSSCAPTQLNGSDSCTRDVGEGEVVLGLALVGLSQPAVFSALVASSPDYPDYY